MGALTAVTEPPRAHEAVVAARSVSKRFGGGRRGGGVRAVSDVSIAVGRGEVVGLVGESGCGKSTLSRMLVGVEPATEGDVLLDGSPVTDAAGWRGLRRRVQYVFQDPFGSLCPTMTIGTPALTTARNGGRS